MSLISRILIVLVLVVGIGLYAVGKLAPSGGGGAPGGAVSVGVAEVIEREVQPWNEFSGRLVAVDQVEIRPRVSGTVDKVHFAGGALVAKDDVLFTIDPKPYEAAVKAAAAHAMLADADLQRARTLLADKAISQRDFDQRKSAAEVARADLTTAKLNLDYTQIKSPITGRVSRAEITVGNLVEAGPAAPVMTTVVTSSPIYADFEVDEGTYLHYAAQGVAGHQEVGRIPVMMGVAGENGTPHEGHVESFDNRLNSASGTIRVRASFDNEGGVLVPGLFAHLRMGSPAKTKALLITDRAIGTDQNRKFVLVVKPDNKTEHREIRLGPVADGLRIVLDGLKAGEKIVVSGMQRVMMPGQEVKPEAEPMEERAAEAGNQKPEGENPIPQDGGEK